MDWRTLSDIGQAFGTVSAVISAVALAGVVNSLRLQRKQTHVSAHDTARSLRMQLVLFAMQNPKYLPIWGFPMQGGQDEASEFAYTSLVFSQLKTSFVLGMLHEAELHDGCGATFRHRGCVDFWRRARNVYLADNTKLGRRFAVIVDRHFREADGEPQARTPASTPTASGSMRLRHAAAWSWPWRSVPRQHVGFSDVDASPRRHPLEETTRIASTRREKSSEWPRPTCF